MMQLVENLFKSGARNGSIPLPGKKGAAFTFRDEGQNGSWKENLPKIISLCPYWNYSWGTRRIDAQPDNIEFIPMIWGGNNTEMTRQSLEKDVVDLIKRGTVKRILAFNEPDEKTQSNMTVETALERWSILESLDVPLISPSCARPNGDWLKSFMSQADAKGKRVDWIGVHWYGGANVASFKTNMIHFHQLYQRPILITEFAPADWNATTVENNRFSPAAVLAFMKDALPWLESQHWIVGYCWFSFKITLPVGTSSALFTENGKLTTCGRYYTSVRSDRPSGDQSISI
jgi:hypothetical protein